MIKSLIIETIQEYDQKREEHKRELNLRKEKLYEQIPELSLIETKMRQIGLEVVRAVQSHPDQVDELTAKLKEKSIDLQMERAEILVSHGYPVDYLEMKFSCNICQDKGFIQTKRCRCFEQRLVDKAYVQSNLHNLLESENFDTFRIDYYSDKKQGDQEESPRKNMEGILLGCINYTKDFDHHNKNLFFYGSPGLGKTFLSNAIAKELLEEGKIVLYQTSSDLIDFIRKNQFDHTNRENPLLERIYLSDLLIIDDLGTENLTEFAKMQLFNIINKRLLTGKKMVISTNLSLRELQEKYPNRFTSRILGHFELYKFYGEDIRIKKKNIL